MPGILFQPMHKRDGNATLLMVGIVLLLLGGLVIAAAYLLTRPEKATPPPKPKPVDPYQSVEPKSVADLTPDQELLPMAPKERELLNRHFTAVGGINLFISMSSFRVAGDLDMGQGRIYGAILIKKGRDLERTTIRTPDFIEAKVLTPDDRWVAYWELGELVKVEDMSPGELREMTLQAPVVDEIFRALQSGWLMQYSGQKNFNYHMAHVFEVQSGQRRTTRFYIDPETYLNVGREDLTFAPDGTLSIVRRVYSDHIEASGLTVPGLVETYIDDQVYAAFHVSTAELNPGVLDSIFYRPEMPVKP